MRPVHLAAILTLLALTLPAAPAQAAGVGGVCDESHLTATLSGGGTVTFNGSGIIMLASTIIASATLTMKGG